VTEAMKKTVNLLSSKAKAVIGDSSPELKTQWFSRQIFIK